MQPQKQVAKTRRHASAEHASAMASVQPDAGVSNHARAPRQTRQASDPAKRAEQRAPRRAAPNSGTAAPVAPTAGTLDFAEAAADIREQQRRQTLERELRAPSRRLSDQQQTPASQRAARWLVMAQREQRAFNRRRRTAQVFGFAALAVGLLVVGLGF